MPSQRPSLKGWKMPESTSQSEEFILTVRVDRPDGSNTEHSFPFIDWPEEELLAEFLAYIIAMRHERERIHDPDKRRLIFTPRPWRSASGA